MPYAVWLEMTAPEPIADAAAGAQLPGLIVDLLKAGWDVPAVPWLDHEDDPSLADEDDTDDGPGLLDMRVVGYRDGAMIGLAVDTDVLEIATAIGASLGRHLADAAPALLGWTTESLRAVKLAAPDADGDWLPPLPEDGPRFSVAEHLRDDLLGMAAQFLIAGAVRELHDPTGESRYTPEAVDAADLVAGAEQHPWGRELAGELGTLLIAAGRHEAVSGTRRSLTPHGGGDSALAQQLLEAIRAEIDQPAIGYDDDRMRGHVLVEDFMERHDLQWNRRSDDLDDDADERRSREQLRALLWSGLRVLATLTHDLADHAESPWLWLAKLECDDLSPAVGVLAELDDERLAMAAEDDDEELAAAAEAHVLVRAALLRPDLLDGPTLNEPGSPFSDITVTAGPLHHVVHHALITLGADAIAKAADVKKQSRIAGLLLPPLRAIEALREDDDGPDGDPYSDLYLVLEHLLPPSGSASQRVRQARDVLSLITAAAAAQPDTPARIARELFLDPAATACVLLSTDDENRTVQRLRSYILIAATALDPAVAGSFAADLPALRSNDPRDEPALRNEINIWWSRTVEVLRRLPALLREQPPCPDPGAALFKSAVADEGEPAGALDGLPTTHAAIAVAQAISAISIALDDPDFPAEILR
ncbi:hypothetical protein GCM10027445_10640 [Amycolatopsis endophytica]|uniref:Uncharacterized protein n=1 Tax=Amycolatopsis endophytica TaxID=860233 RepID=A0A853AX91_9PSEU|nr:hypothetical protein [Amycolatopsis endophytica]NYI87298.1 hypothetical protein [Amycolatopsis endophytica]